MLARSSTVGLVAATALSLAAGPMPCFNLESTGAVRLAVTSDEASYGIVAPSAGERPVLTIALGATRAAGSLSLYTHGDEPLRPGRYPMRMSFLDRRGEGRAFHACFVAGTAERPVGVFHSERGWVVIESVEGARIAGSFQLEGRGFLAADPDDEDQLVSIRGSFVASGDTVKVAMK
jgi:hypothetical protein